MAASSIRSPSSESSSSPTGVSSETGSWATFWISRTRSGVTSSSWAISAMVGSRPRSCSSWRCTRESRLMVSTMCTGTRIVRAWSAIARVMACRIHQVAYVENL